MNITIYNSKDFKTKQWSGGDSTELYVYPSNAEYDLRNFNFRISTASVEVEKSNFTSLPSVYRQLMVLLGSVTITHKNHHQVKLNSGDVDIFDGGWETSSVGTCVDFNLMTTSNTKGKLSSLSIAPNNSMNYLLDSASEFILFYVYEGDLQLDFSLETRNLNQGELMVIHNSLVEVIQLHSTKNCTLVIVNIGN